MVQRIVGLASGMDIDSMVKQLMTAEKVPLDKMKQKQQVLEWQRDDYRTLNSLFLDFQNNTLFNMKLSTQFRVRTTSSSNDNLVTATASSGASLSSYTISSVKQLAGAATRVVNNKISGGTTIDPTGSLIDQTYSNQTFKWVSGSVKSQTLNATADGVIPSLNLNGDTLIDTDAMNVQVNGKNYKVVTDITKLDANSVFLDKTNGNTLQFDSSVQPTIKSGNAIKIDYVVDSATDSYAKFQLQTYDNSGNSQSQNFLVSGKDSLNNVINNVNSSKLGVTMFYDSASDKITLSRNKTGQFNKNTANSEIITTDLGVNNDFLNKALGFSSSVESGGQNAKFTINGLDTERSTNTFVMNGVTLTLKQAFNTGDPNNPNIAAPVSVSIQNDSDTVFNNIKAFVDKYNTLIDTVNNKINEDRYRDYPPLTDDQKEQLSDTQQEKWDAKAKSGLLKGDTILSGALNQMRSLIYQPVQNSVVSSNYNQLTKIGITTTANFLDGGKLVIDETKLKAALADDPDSVEKMFNGIGDTVSSQGIATRLSNNVTTIMNQLKDKAGSSTTTNKQFAIGRSLDDLSDQINSFNDRLTQIEDRYYSQFTAMDQAIQQSNTQATYIQKMFSS